MTAPATTVTRPRPRRERLLTVRDGRVSSRQLLNEDGLLWIRHGDGLYQLRQTASGKLILTK
ncbi:hemin uptake protein HemP [Isoalcanivorax beigongshangi]|uniref:Hemin uptake protein HemP n=1 Tax=Isoalcanivorax beigongshangi TaxID=3238810 RepID=A0ABV4AJB1_9GAMM